MSDFDLPEPDSRGLEWRHRDIPSNFDDLTAEQHGQAAEALETTLNNNQKVIFKK